MPTGLRNKRAMTRAIAGPTRFPFRIAASLLLILCSLIAPPDSSAAMYTYTKLADTTGTFNAFFNATINESGTVAFRALLDSGPQAIFSSSGGAATTIAVAPSSTDFGAPSINNNGSVAFVSSGMLLGSEKKVVVGNGGALTTIASNTGTFDDFGSILVPTIFRNSGTVAFAARMDDNTRSIFTGAGGTATLVVDSTGPFQTLDDPTVNNLGVFAFAGGMDGTGQGIFRGSAGSFITIANTLGSFNGFSALPTLTDAGTVMFQAGLDGGGAGIFTGTGGATTTIADTSGAYGGFGNHVMNNHGTLAFVASMDGFINPGIFTGPNPLTDSIVKYGDAFDGSFLETFFLTRGAMNDAGQFVFHAQLFDDRQVLVLATPLVTAAVPEPSVIGLLAVGGILAWRRRFV